MSVFVSIIVGRQVQPAGPRPPVDGWGIEVPLGTTLHGVGMQNGNLAVLALVPNPNGVRVWHPLILLPLGGHYDPTLGRQIGQCFGTTMIANNVMGVFADMPWPNALAPLTALQAEAAS